MMHNECFQRTEFKFNYKVSLDLMESVQLNPMQSI